MRIVYLPSADEDLLDIYCAIGIQNEPAAHRLIDRIHAALMRLKDFPLSAPLRTDVGPDVRGVAVGAYVALYWLADDSVQIVRIVHAARDMHAFAADFADQ